MNGDESGIHGGGFSESISWIGASSPTAVVRIVSNLIIRSGTSGKGV
jgi:hypothetical protein